MLPQHWLSLTKFRQELKQKPEGRKWDRDHRRWQLTVFFFPHGLPTLSSYTTEDHLPRAVTTHIRLGFLTSIHQSLTKKTPHRYAHSLNKAILQLRVPLPTSPYFVAKGQKTVSASKYFNFLQIYNSPIVPNFCTWFPWYLIGSTKTN